MNSQGQGQEQEPSLKGQEQDQGLTFCTETWLLHSTDSDLLEHTNFAL